MNDLFHKIAKEKKLGKYKEKKFKTKSYREAISNLENRFTIKYNRSTRRFDGVTREFCIAIKEELECCGINTYKDCSNAESVMGIMETFNWIASEIEGIFEYKNEMNLEDAWKKDIYQQEKPKKYLVANSDCITYMFMCFVKNQ